MHGKKRCLGVEAGCVDSRSDLAYVPAVARGVSPQDRRGIGVRHVVGRILKDPLCKVLNKRNSIGMLDSGGHTRLLSLLA
jgi:hypothetical protein